MRPHRAFIAVFIVCFALGSGATVAAAGGSSDDSDRVGEVPAAAQKIMDKKAYRGARWIWRVEDPENGDVLLANRPDELAFTASTAKQFTVGTAFDVLGPNARLTTPVYATAAPNGGVVAGDLVLVASGDLALGGRGAPDAFEWVFGPDGVDHVYGDIAPNAVVPPGDPLAGLNDLAGQIAAKGITRVDGNVLVDERIWDVYQGQEGPVPPIFVNDNVLDITVTPGAEGEAATVSASPETSAFTVVSEVETQAGDDPASVEVEADEADPRRVVVTGTIGADGGPHNTIYRIEDAATWARTLFIEALGRAGVTVTAPALAENDPAALPPAGSYSDDQEVASLESPTIRAFGQMILETSYNTGANTLLCLLAVHEGSTNCVDGLGPIYQVVDEAGLNQDEVFLVDGQGRDPASTTPRQMAKYIAWTQDQPWARAFNGGQPVLGESGSLASHGRNHPAKGKVQAKTGTSAAVDPFTGRGLWNVQSLAGFIETDDGRRLVFDLAMSGGVYPDVLTGLNQSGHDLALVAAAFQRELSK